jgi:hypothetical protein
MPVRIGFAEYRSQLLRQELERVIEELPGLGALKVILIGDLLTGNVHPSSILEMFIVQETEDAYLDRIDFFLSHLRPTVGIDISVYTPEEVVELETRNIFVRKVLKSGGVLYEI